MNEPITPGTVAENTSAFPEHAAPGRRVFLDASSPPVRSILRVGIIILLLIFFAGTVQAIFSNLASFIFLISLSIFFAYLLDPLVRSIRRPFKGKKIEKLMPRALAIIVAYFFIFTIIGVAVAYIAPVVSEQAKEFGANLPAYGQALRARSSDLNQRFDRLRVPEEVQAEINKRITEFGSQITGAVGDFVLISFTYLPWLLLIPILAFFFLRDANLFRLSLLRFFPVGPWRYRAEALLGDVNTTLAAYTRAALLSCLLISLICTTGFYLLGLKYAFLLGILAGVFEFVPLIGPVILGLFAILTAAASDHPWSALHVAIFLAVLRLIHDYFTYPRIVRGGIHLHPLAIILSVLAGEQVAGIPGVFLAIPVVAVGTVVYRHVLEHQDGRKSLAALIEEAESQKQETT